MPPSDETIPSLGDEGSDTDARSKPRDSRPLRGLVVVATPIGNAGDITLRALDALKGADVIACEDTRVSGNLLRRYGISTSLTPYHEHNASRVRPRLIQRLEGGETVALISDAGTPLVSDPGFRLVRDCVTAGIAVVHLPGPSSVLTALVLSGLPTDRFLFCGFTPTKSKARRDLFSEVAAIRASLVFLESPNRLAASLNDMAEILGSRPASVSREMTKMFEETRRGSVPELAAHYAENGNPKGEITVVVGPPPEISGPDDDAVDAMIAEALAARSLRDAVADVVQRTGRAPQGCLRPGLEDEGWREMTPLPGTRRKRNAYRWGRWAESLCAAILRTRGYRILARRWRCPSGEIDIVACRRGIAVFVEVKARDRYETAVESIAPPATEANRPRGGSLSVGASGIGAVGHAFRCHGCRAVAGSPPYRGRLAIRRMTIGSGRRKGQ